MARVGDFVADHVFDGTDDLVVGAASMDELADARLITVVHDFRTNERVHHVQRFVQPETVRTIRSNMETKSA
ncbi:MAG: hypothetical protein C0505_07910 [Leptothrix sp. (in: Bacteria)]|nr:hypothetical protein [Leptothrix sp. (in: b-proteobacteria)]